MACIFRLFKYLKRNNLQRTFFEAFSGSLKSLFAAFKGIGCGVSVCFRDTWVSGLFGLHSLHLRRGFVRLPMLSANNFLEAMLFVSQ